jgi:hypothetical protein
MHAIEATKVCSNTTGTIDGEEVNLYDEFCSTAGSATEAPPEEWETRSVSLIQWPP